MSDLVHRLALETPEFYISPFGKINHRLVNLSYNCDVKSGLRFRTKNDKNRIISEMSCVDNVKVITCVSSIKVNWHTSIFFCHVFKGRQFS